MKISQIPETIEYKTGIYGQYGYFPYFQQNTSSFWKNVLLDKN